MRPRLLFACVTTAGAFGCTLLTGAGDFTVESGDGSSSGTYGDGASGGEGDASTSSDVTTEEPVTITRLKDITFEDNALTHPVTGVDSFGGNVNVQTGLAGFYAAKANAGGYVVETIDPVGTLYVSALLRFDTIASPELVGRLTTNNGATIDMVVTGVAPSYSFELRFGGSSVSSAETIAIGTTYRVGIRFRGMGQTSVRLQVARAGQPLVGGASTGGNNIGNAATSISFGARNDGGTSLLVDNIRLDSADMPEE
jgi:hypothetical protein